MSDRNKRLSNRPKEFSAFGSSWVDYSPAFYIASVVALLSIVFGVVLGVIPIMKAQDALAHGKTYQGVVLTKSVDSYGLIPPLSTDVLNATFQYQIEDGPVQKGYASREARCGCDASFQDGSRKFWVPGAKDNVHYLSSDNYVFGDEVPDVDYVVLLVFGALAAVSIPGVIAGLMEAKDYSRRKANLAENKIQPSGSLNGAVGTAEKIVVFAANEGIKRRLNERPLYIQLTFITLMLAGTGGIIWYYMANGLPIFKALAVVGAAPAFALIPVIRRAFIGRDASRIARTLTDNSGQTLEFQRSLNKTLLATPWSKNRFRFGRASTHDFMADGKVWVLSVTPNLSRFSFHEYRHGYPKPSTVQSHPAAE